MISPDTIRAAFAAKLRDIAALVALFGGDGDNIVEYVDEEAGDVWSTIYALDPGKLLVVYQGTAPRSGRRELWQHNFSLIWKTDGSPAAVFKQIVDGVPEDETLPMLNVEIVTTAHQMNTPSMGRRSIPVADGTALDYWEITTGFVEK